MVNTDLKDSIRRLTPRELRTVISSLPEIAKEGLEASYASDKESWAQLQRLSPSEATAFLSTLAPDTRIADETLSDETSRALLIELTKYPEYEPYLRKAMGRRVLAAIDPVLGGALLVFVLSIKWKVKAKKKNGKWEWEFEASKNPTAAAFLKTLLAHVPGLGSILGK